MQESILNLDKIKIYYPFFRDNRGLESSLLDELNYLVGYLLVVDVIVVPPRELIGGSYGAKNIETIKSSKLLSHLIRTGRIVTSSSSTMVRDTKDLIEYYSTMVLAPPSEFWIYKRDSKIQKRSYSSHLTAHLDMAQYYSDSIKSELRHFLGSFPDHIGVMNKIKYLSNRMHPAEYERLKLEAFHGYFSGGSVGNGAIMPCMYSNDGKSSIYNPFYSKATISKFVLKLQSLRKKELHKVSVSELEKLFNNLRVFKIRYAELSKSYEHYYTKIAALLGRRSVSIKLPTDILYVTVSLLIASLFVDSFTKEVFWGSFVAAYTAKGAWSYIDKAFKITNYFTSKLQSYLKFTGLYDEFRKDLIELTEEFETRVEKATSH